MNELQLAMTCEVFYPNTTGVKAVNDSIRYAYGVGIESFLA